MQITSGQEKKSMISFIMFEVEVKAKLNYTLE